MAEKEKKNNVVPQEYVDKMQEFDVEAWRQSKIDEALKNLSERDPHSGGDLPPTWWGEPRFVELSDGSIYRDFDSDVYGPWWNCISTATSPYGEQYRVIGNKSFLDPKSSDYFQKKGFRELQEDEASQYGDLIQLNNLDGVPFHMMTYTGDRGGKRLYTYGAGPEDRFKRNHAWNFDKDNTTARRFRFVGSPNDIAEIEAHNAKVKEYEANTAPLRENHAVQLQTSQLDTNIDKNKVVNQTADWLGSIAKYGKKK